MLKKISEKIQILNSNALKIIAIICMFCDHIWGTIIPGNNWLTIIGRISFPIFAFLVVEGFYKTKDLKKYIKRMFILALISEIPFNLMFGGNIFFPFHQNVIFSFVISLLFMAWMEKSYKEGKFKFITVSFFATVLGFLFTTILFVDYYGFGLLITFVFYFAKKIKYTKLVEFIGMLIINCIIMEGKEIPINILGNKMFIKEQAFAILSLIPIWLYNGKLGKKNKFIQYGFYLVYPIHMLILATLALYILK